MKDYKEYKNYIFDLYGTLIDLEVDEQAAKTWKKWCKWLDGQGIKHPVYYKFRKDFFDRDKSFRQVMLSEGVYKYPEIDVIDIYRQLFSLYGNDNVTEEFLWEASYKFRQSSMLYIRLFPDVKKFFDKLAANGINAYILSNAQASYTIPEIKMFELDKCTKGQLLSSDCKCMKPEKHFFDMLIEKYDLSRDECVMVGDSFENDAMGAKGAGMDYIHLTGENSSKVFYTNMLEKL